MPPCLVPRPGPAQFGAGATPARRGSSAEDPRLLDPQRPWAGGLTHDTHALSLACRGPRTSLVCQAARGGCYTEPCRPSVNDEPGLDRRPLGRACADRPPSTGGPLARRQLKAEVNADALTIRGSWRRRILRGGEPRNTVVLQVDVGKRPDVAAWMQDPSAGGATQRVDWLFLPKTPEAVLLAAVDGPEPLRFNLRFYAGGDRRRLETVARSRVLGLITAPLQLDEEQRPASPVVLVPVPTRPLRDFLRDVPSGAVV
jgi:hypothetical protein